ncbi:MAG: T9SS type A sorting domain-containing protein [Candidatus Hatepunaea meridiana]|nr:T9SS type A sorting domain-containing protein [Candidatus Hatepunaea meridiana]
MKFWGKMRFNAQMRIVYGLPEAELVNLTVYDLAGRRVSELANERQKAGFQTVIFDGSELVSGIYIIRLEAAGRSSQWKIVLVK